MQNQVDYKMTYRETLVSEEAMVDLCQIEGQVHFPSVYSELFHRYGLPDQITVATV